MLEPKKGDLKARLKCIRTIYVLDQVFDYLI
jgi:hypothetical protein